MRRLIVSSVLSTLALAASASAWMAMAGCSGGDIPVGAISQSAEALQKKSDGTATGNGQTCSWAGTSLAAAAAESGDVSSYLVGATFKSPDTCNDCSCSAQGIMCTVRVCPPPNTSSSSGGTSGGQPCPAIAKVCPDGSSVGPTGPNCEIPACPPPVVCSSLAKACPDGTFVSATGPNCVIPACPPPVVCPAIAKACPDGSSVSPAGPKCEYPACPPPVACPAIARVCPDGSSVSPTGPNCVIPDCPPDCAAAECPPPPPFAAIPCPGTNTLAQPHCVRKNNVCSWTGPICL